MDTSNANPIIPCASLPGIEIQVIYQDDAILVINKPSGLLSIPDGYDLTLPHVAGCLSTEFGKVWIVHRLDRETSGVMLLARTKASHRELNLQFEHRQVIKVYLAFITGQPEWNNRTADAPLMVNGDRKHRTIVAPLTGKASQTDFQVLQRFSWGCLIQAKPHTGYTHQIRAHLAFLGYPILGDELYRGSGSNQKSKGDSRNPPPAIHRLALHAFSIEFSHPTLQEPKRFTAPLPENLRNLA